MPTIENYAEHPFQFPKPTKATGDGPLAATSSMVEEAITFPRAGGQDEGGNVVPSRTNVSAEDLKLLKEHRVAKGWFGRTGLQVSAQEHEDFDPANDSALGSPNQKAKPKGKG